MSQAFGIRTLWLGAFVTLSVCLGSGVPALAQKVKIRVELVDAHCNEKKNTEDIMGADELYVVSAMAGVDTKKAVIASKGVVTKPIAINTKETKPFPDDKRVLFEGEVPVGGAVVGGLVAFDEDYEKDWEKKDKEIAKKITDLVAGASTFAGPKGAVVAGITKGVFEVVDKLSQADKDDELGKVDLEIPADGPPEEIKDWDFESKEGGGIVEKIERKTGYSDWSYKVRYRIIRQK